MQMTFYLDDWVGGYRNGSACGYTEIEVCNTTEVKLCDMVHKQHTQDHPCGTCNKVKRNACVNVTVPGCDFDKEEICTTEYIQEPVRIWEIDQHGRQVWVSKKPREFVRKPMKTCIDKWSTTPVNFTYLDCIKELEPITLCEHSEPEPE